MLPVPIEPLAVPREQRDVAIATLEALARVRLATTAGLLAYAKPDGFDPELLGVWEKIGFVLAARAVTDPVRGTTEHVLAVSPAGARALAEVTGRAAKSVSPARLKRSSRKLAHDAAVGDVLLAVLSLARGGSPALAGIESDDRVLATSAVVGESGRAVRVPLQPDAFIVTGPGGCPSGLLVELDRGTTSVAKLRAKFGAYAAWRLAGGPERAFGIRAMRVITVVPDAKRLRRLHDAALDAIGRRSGFFLFALASDLTPADPERMRGPVVRQLGDATCVPLFPSN